MDTGQMGMVICIPLVCHESPVGVLFLASREHHPFCEAELNMARARAEQVTVAVPSVLTLERTPAPRRNAGLPSGSRM